MNLREIDDLDIWQALRALDLASPEQVVEWATAKVAVGSQDGRALELASLYASDMSQVDTIVSMPPVQIGKVRPTFDSGMLSSYHFAQLLLGGHLSPIGAARKLWRIANLVPDTEAHLNTFIQLADDWEDDPSSRSDVEMEILAEAEALIAVVAKLERQRRA